MIKSTNPAHPAASARLANVVASSLPEEVKAGLTTAGTSLTALWAEQPDASIPPAMLLAVNALHDQGTALTVDLLRVLTGLAPHVRSHRAQNIGALLRTKRKQVRRPFGAADFPGLGRVSLFAAAYWGGIDAWAAGAPGRVQRPKGFWRVEANQLDALRAFAHRHLGRPITTLNLSAAGYPALAIALRGADIEALVVKAGLGARVLKRDPHSDAKWTADVVLDRYVALCRQHGITLSTTALLALGGEASSLQGHARRLFGRFGAMVDAARLRAPELQPLKSPVAKDGTRLDSWSEVVVWNAVCAALPGVELRAHVVLPGEAARSVDILVAGTVYVEVLMTGLAEMATPTSRTQAAYASKWAAKAVIYAARGIEPIVIEPADVHDPVRLARCIEEVGRRIGMGPLPPPPPTGKQTRAKGSWDEQALHEAVGEVADRVGAFPTYAQLTEYGYGHAAILLRQPGMRQRVASALGLPLVHQKNVWDRDRVIAEMLAWVREHGGYPTVAQLLQARRSDLAGALYRLGRGKAKAVRAEVERQHGTPLPQTRRPDGCYASLAGVAELLRPLAERLGYVPTLRECTAAGLGPVWYAMSRGWGVAAVAAHLGLPTVPRGIRLSDGSRLL